jgi:hypothetical protein
LTDNTTDKILVTALAVFVTLIAAYTKDPNLTGGAMVIAGYAVKAIASRVQNANNTRNS